MKLIKEYDTHTETLIFEDNEKILDELRRQINELSDRIKSIDNEIKSVNYLELFKNKSEDE